MKNMLLVVTCIALVASGCSDRPSTDLIVIGKIWTGNANTPWAEAIAISEDSIVAVGSKSEIEKWIGDKTEKIETTEGNLVVPGFIDCHTHFIDGGFALSSVKLRDAKSPEEFISRIAAFAKTLPEGAWITSGDWDHENWGGTLPTRDWIDSVTQRNPLWINRLDGHMCLANSAALKAASINESVKDVSGGTIVR